MITIYFIGIILCMMFYQWSYMNTDRYLEEGYSVGPTFRILLFSLLWFISLPIIILLSYYYLKNNKDV